MSVKDIFKATPTVATLRSLLEAAEVEYSTLTEQLGALALQAEIGTAADRAALTSHRASITSAKQRIENLTAAIATAQREEQREQAEGLAKVRRTQLATVTKHLKALDAAGDRYAAGIAEANAAFHEMIAAGNEARRACPVGLEWPKCAHIGGDLIGDCERELYRQCGEMVGDPNASGLVMPGVKWNPYEPPSAMPVMTQVLATASKNTVRRLRDQIDAARLAVVSPATGSELQPTATARPQLGIVSSGEDARDCAVASQEADTQSGAPSSQPAPAPWDARAWAESHPAGGAEDDLTREDREWLAARSGAEDVPEEVD